MNNPRIDRRAGVGISRYVPYSSHVTQHVIRTREGDFVRAWRVQGVTFETTDAIDIEARHEALNQLIRSFSDDNVCVWVHRVRRRISDNLHAKYEDATCRRIDEEYAKTFCDYGMMACEMYFTIVLRPQIVRARNIFGRRPPRTLNEIREDETGALRLMDDVAARVETAMSTYGLESLGIYESNGLKYSHALELFGYLLNGVWEPVPIPNGKVADALPTSRLFFAAENIEIRTAETVRYGALLDIKDYPPVSFAGATNTLLLDHYEYIETQSFSPLGKHVAIGALGLQKNQLIASQDAGQTQIFEIDEAIEGIINGDFSLGEYHYSIAVFGEDLRAVQTNVARCRIRLQEAGFQSALVDVVPDAAWFAQLPANWRYRVRDAKLTSRNFAGFACFHNFASGKRSGNPWGDAVTILKTPNRQPFYFNFHHSPAGVDSEDEMLPANTLVIGQTGSGKTVLTLFLLTQAMKFSPTVVYFDKDRSAEIAIRAMGGQYFALQRGVATGFNPFQMEPTERNISFWEALVRQLVGHSSLPLMPKDEQDISRAVRTVAGMPRELRRLTTVRQNLPNVSMNSVNARLRKWCWGEPMGWLLDNPVERINFSDFAITAFDYTEFLDDPEIRTPAMMYLMERVDRLIDGRRFIYFMSEFWKPLSDPVFVEFARDKQKTIRKQNGFGVFDTQSPADILSNQIAKTMIEQTATMILLPNPGADHADYVQGLKLTEKEFELVRKLNPSGRSFLIKQGHRSAVASLDLSSMKFALKLLSGTTENVALVQGLIREQGEEPSRWLPMFESLTAGGHEGEQALPERSSK